MPDAGGPLWLFIDVLLVAVLAGALIYGMVMWRRWKTIHAQPRRAIKRPRNCSATSINSAKSGNSACAA